MCMPSKKTTTPTLWAISSKKHDGVNLTPQRHNYGKTTDISTLKLNFVTDQNLNASKLFNFPYQLPNEPSNPCGSTFHKFLHIISAWQRKLAAVEHQNFITKLNLLITQSSHFSSRNNRIMPIACSLSITGAKNKINPLNYTTLRKQHGIKYYSSQDPPIHRKCLNTIEW